MKFRDNKELKNKLYEIIFGTDTPAGKLFDVTLMCFIIFSVLITIFQSAIEIHWLNKSLYILEFVFGVFFTLEYILRIYCSPKPKDYAFSFFGVIDLLSILPFVLTFVFTQAHYLLILRSFRLVRVFRVFKLFNFLNEGHLLLTSIQKSLNKIFVFFLFVFILNISLGTIMFVVENSAGNPQFSNIPNAIYWSIVTMTTVGYGDITPITGLGKAISAFTMLLGYTIIAVPTGIVSSELINAQNNANPSILYRKHCPNCGEDIHYEDANYCRKCGAPLDE